MGADFKRARAALAHDAERVCRRYLPRGRRVGDWWRAPVPWRADKHPSLLVSLTTGYWRDAARPGDHGDLIDLIARIEGVPAVEVMRRACGDT